MAAWALRGTTVAQQASAGAVAAWAVKLASFLFFRACITKKDLRLDETLSTFSGQFGFWFISFLWGWLVSLPHTLATGVPIGERPPFGRVHVAGLTMFALGLLLETAADLSKWFFKASSANAGKFCDVGVWNLCQHPNWFGNLLIWTGILILNSPTLLSGIGAGTGSVRILGRSACDPRHRWCAMPLRSRGGLAGVPVHALLWPGQRRPASEQGLRHDDGEARQLQSVPRVRRGYARADPHTGQYCEMAAWRINARFRSP